MSERRTRLALVISAFNEEATIADVVKDARRTFAKSRFATEVVVVDDGSSDRTAARATSAGATVISHILNTGHGGAVATGLSYAESRGFDVAATMDGDGQHVAADVLAGVKILLKDKTDLLIGSRLLGDIEMSRSKLIGNRGLSWITFLLFRAKVTDSQSGLRIFSQKALNQLKWKTSGYEFCSEMLWRAKQLNLSISEYPIRTIYTEYSMAKGQNNWNGFNLVKFLLRQRLVEFFSE